MQAFLNAKRQWLFPLLLVLAAAVAVSVILLAGERTQKETPDSTSDAPVHTEPLAETATEVETDAVPATESQLHPADYLSHEAYMHGFDSFFSPNRSLTRAEAAILIYRLFGGEENAEAFFYDVSEDSGNYHEIAAVCDRFPSLREDRFLPDEPVLREDLFAALCSAAGQELPDELLSEDAPYTAFALRRGWFYADAASDYVSRGEAAHIFNRVSGRSPDRLLLLRETPVIFVDVSPSCPYYADIMEAAAPHEYYIQGTAERWDDTAFAELDGGLYRQNGVAYYLRADGTLLTTPGLQEIPSGTVLVADESGLIYADNRPHWTPDGVVFCRRSGTILKGGSYNGCTFDESGFYTSGDAELDAYVQAVYDECTTADMAQAEKLRACYDYVRDFRYLGRNSPLADSVKTMPTDLALGYARKIFETGKGDCYNFTAAFLFLARGLGYDAEGVIGYCGYMWSRSAIPHGWVTITMDDGAVYLFDPQIENYNLRAGVSNEYYGAFMTTYEQSYANYYPN